MTRRTAFIVKYLLPDEQRVSGLASFASSLLDGLASRVDLHVFSQCARSQAGPWSETHGYKLYPLPRGFWLRVGRAVAQADPDSVVLLSGVHRARLIYPAFRPLVAALGTNARTVFYQGVHLDRVPGRMACRLLGRFDRLVCTTNKLRAMFPEPLASRCKVIPPGCDVDRVRAVLPAPKGRAFRVGYFNHLNRLKGLDIALQTFAGLPFDDTEYVIAGTGPMSDNVCSDYDGRGGIRFLGYLPDPMPDLKACDVAVLPFRTDVSVLGISYAALACLAAGVPVIASDNDAITPAIRHEREGLIYRSPHELAGCIRRLHDDPGLRARLARNAALRAEDFRIEAAGDRLCRLIEGGAE